METLLWASRFSEAFSIGLPWLSKWIPCEPTLFQEPQQWTKHSTCLQVAGINIVWICFSLHAFPTHQAWCLFSSPPIEQQVEQWWEEGSSESQLRWEGSSFQNSLIQDGIQIPVSLDGAPMILLSLSGHRAEGGSTTGWGWGVSPEGVATLAIPSIPPIQGESTNMRYLW
jgi:hypothetical protein